MGRADLVGQSISKQWRPSVVHSHSRFEAVDFEREQADHLLTQLQLRLHSGCCLRVAFTILHHVSRQQVEDESDGQHIKQHGGWRHVDSRAYPYLF